MLASNVGKPVLWQSIYTTIKNQSYSRGSKTLPRNIEQPRDSSHLLRGRRSKSKPLLWIRSSEIPSSILCAHTPVLRGQRHAAIHPPASPCFTKMGVSLTSTSAGAFAGTAPAVTPGDMSDTLGHSCKTLANCPSPTWHNGERQGHPGPSSSQGVRPEARKQGAIWPISCPSTQGTGCATEMMALQDPSPCTPQQLLLRAVPIATQVAPCGLLTALSCCDSSLEIQNFSLQNFLRESL